MYVILVYDIGQKRVGKNAETLPAVPALDTKFRI